MFFDLQKASMLKRIAAWIFDLIMLAIITVGLLALISAIFGMEYHNAHLQEIYTKYETQYGISFNLTAEELQALPEDKLAIYEEADKALSQDTQFQELYSKVLSVMLMSVSLSIFIAYVLMEFLVPLLFGNGQTAGKKMFSIAVMRTDGMKVSTFMMFARSILGKCTVETMIPVLLILMIFFGVGGLECLVILGLILLLQVILMLKTQNNSAIHDLMACTVVVDMNSQMIFESEQHRLDYQARLEAESAQHRNY